MVKPDIMNALEREGINIIKKGRTFWACCPLHTEKTPSFKVDPERQTFYCFGCHKKGDVITLVMELRGLSFKEARSYLGIKVGKGKPNQIYVAEAKERKELVEIFRAWEKETRDEIGRVLRLYRHSVAIRDAPYAEAELDELARTQGKIDHLEYIYGILCGKDDVEKYEIYRQENGL